MHPVYTIKLAGSNMPEQQIENSLVWLPAVERT